MNLAWLVAVRVGCRRSSLGGVDVFAALQAGGRRFEPGTLHSRLAGVSAAAVEGPLRATPRLPHARVRRDRVQALNGTLRSAWIEMFVALEHESRVLVPELRSDLKRIRVRGPGEHPSPGLATERDVVASQSRLMSGSPGLGRFWGSSAATTRGPLRVAASVRGHRKPRAPRRSRRRVHERIPVRSPSPACRSRRCP
jgi:hypothetical protein